MDWRSDAALRHLENQARRLFKGSSLIPFALGGSVLGGAAAGGASMLAKDPYRDTKTDALRGGAVGAGLGLGMYGLSRLPAWSVLPATLAAGFLGWNAMDAREPNIPANYDWEAATLRSRGG